MIGINVKHFLRYDNRLRLIIIGVFIGIVALASSVVITFFRPPLLRITFYAVGQGDGIFIETPERVQILIDGGRDATMLRKITKDMPFYDRDIDLMIATHPDADHISGLIDILERYNVQAILLPRIKSDTVVYKRFLDAVIKEKALVKEARGIHTIALDKDTSFIILNPLPSLPYENDNDYGIVGVLRYGNFDTLFTADISSKEEERLLPFLPEGIEVLKVAHHGSRFSSSFSFLKKVYPAISIIQVGKNNYGHPSPDVIERLASIGSRLWRTDIQGDLRISSDGKTYWID